MIHKRSEFRRMQDGKHCQKLIRLTALGGLHPVAWWKEDGKGGKYPYRIYRRKRSSYLKRCAAKAVRRCRGDIPHGGGYRRVFDFWCELY